ncbi:MAG: methyltransferase domain-containing protein [Pseudomonadota bacterium]
MNDRVKGGQSTSSSKKNAEFFLDEYDDYKENVASIDTYQLISAGLSKELRGAGRVLDVGNGGVFSYDTQGVREIVGLDLFLDELPKDLELPENVTMVQGSALDIPQELLDFDGVVIVMLIHHLIGKTVAECIGNVRQLFSEVYRVLKPGGRILIVESCIPPWFYIFEKMVFLPATFVIENTIKHPPTLQYPVKFLERAMTEAGFVDVASKTIPKGRFVIQYGFKVPSWVTPVQPVLFSAEKP